MTRPLIARLGLILVAVLVAALPVYSQTAISGHLKDAGGHGIAGSATTFIQLDLLYCGQNEAKVSGVAVLPGTASYRFSPDATGTITIPALYGNDVIACGAVTGGTRWAKTTYVKNVSGPSCRLNISGTSFNLDTATCENAVPPPATPTTNYENISHSWTAPQTFGIGTTFPTLDTTAANTWTHPQSVQTTGTYTDSAINWQSAMLDGLTKANITSLQTMFAPIYLTDVLDIGQLTPSSSTVYQATGLSVFAQTNSAVTNQVSIYSQCLAGVNNAKCWGYNPSAADYDFNGTQYTNVTLHGIEIDVNVKNSSTSGDALFIQGLLGGNTLGNIGAIHIPKPATGSWGYGLQIDDQALLSSNSQGLFIGSSGTVSAPSYQIILRGRNGAGVSQPARIFADQNGAQTNAGVMTTNGAYSTGASAGDVVVYNGASIKSDSATHNAAFPLISGNVSNKVSIDSGAQGVVTGGAVAIGAGLTVAGGASIANSNAVPQVGTPTVGQAACIKAAGPPVVIGYCSTVVSAGGACTCN